ncbi:molybdate ABC transporter inner membrane subunit, partial [Calderihabitans maritimus]
MMPGEALTALVLSLRVALLATALASVTGVACAR